MSHRGPIFTLHLTLHQCERSVMTIELLQTVRTIDSTAKGRKTKTEQLQNTSATYSLHSDVELHIQTIVGRGGLALCS